MKEETQLILYTAICFILFTCVILSSTCMCSSYKTTEGIVYDKFYSRPSGDGGPGEYVIRIIKDNAKETFNVSKSEYKNIEIGDWFAYEIGKHCIPFVHKIKYRH